MDFCNSIFLLKMVALFVAVLYHTSGRTNMVTLKLGDMVRVDGEHHVPQGIHSLAGAVGKIVQLHDNGVVGVEFTSMIGGHDCEGRAKQGHGWHLYESSVTKLYTIKEATAIILKGQPPFKKNLTKLSSIRSLELSGNLLSKLEHHGHYSISTIISSNCNNISSTCRLTISEIKELQQKLREQGFSW